MTIFAKSINFGSETEKNREYGTWKLLGKKRRPHGRGKDPQALGRGHQQWGQVFPRPEQEKTP